MSKAILISIRPEWCELIASGEKTIEVRKSRPKLVYPFKCYIYCTKEPGNSGKSTRFYEDPYGSFASADKNYSAFLTGTVIGEFVCDQIEEIAVAFNGGSGPMKAIGGNRVWFGGMVQLLSCLNTEDICRYIGGIGGKGYGWHISDLKIYKEPKPLTAFQVECPRVYCVETCKHYKKDCNPFGFRPLNRPPQSWCYVHDSGFVNEKMFHEQSNAQEEDS